MQAPIYARNKINEGLIHVAIPLLNNTGDGWQLCGNARPRKVAENLRSLENRDFRACSRATSSEQWSDNVLNT